MMASVSSVKSNGERIFLTGASGLVGNRCLIRALQKGYDVIASVRSSDTAKAVRKAIQGLVDTEHLSFVVVPDLTVEGCFDDCMPEVDYIVHAAKLQWTVTHDSQMDETDIHPAVQGAMSILNVAKEAKTVKKVVICSSLAALTTFEKCFGPDIDGITYTAESRVPDSHYETVKDHPGEQCFAAKTLGLNATDRMVKEGLPFDVINIFPSTVIGRFEPSKDIEDFLSCSNIRGLAILLGKTQPPLPTSCVHVDDVAKMHIDILSMKTEKCHNFGAGTQMNFNEQADIARRHFPDAVEKGVFPCDGKSPDRKFLFDTAETEAFFGWKFKSFEEMVVDNTTQYLELLAKSAP